MSPELETARTRILEAALLRVPFDGWTWATVEAAAKDVGLDTPMTRRCFPRGLAQVLEFFMSDADRRMVEELEHRNLSAMKIRERIATAVRVRLEQNSQHRDAIRRALAVQTTPRHAPAGIAGMAHTVDLMWRAAGDRATDFNWYTKRALLAAVYGSTLLHWLDDTSPESEATWAFLDRRIENVMQIQKLRGRLDRSLAGFDAPLKRALTKFGQRAARSQFRQDTTQSI